MFVIVCLESIAVVVVVVVATTADVDVRCDCIDRICGHRHRS